jgi:hypothetical protein
MGLKQLEDTSPDYIKNISSMYQHKVNNISPDQPIQYNFASKPMLYSSATPGSKGESQAGNFQLFLQNACQP